MDDANSALQDVSTTRGIQTYCDIVIDSSQKATGQLILIYNGTVCSGKTRTGSITINLPFNGSAVTRWSVAGCRAVLTFYNYKVTNASNNKSLTLNGSASMINVNGGGYLQLVLGTPIINQVRANMALTFDDGTTRNWKTAARRTLSYIGSYPNGTLKSAIAGDTIIGSHNKVEMWGTDRAGENFTIDMPTDYSYDIYNPGTNCIYKPLTGMKVNYWITHELTQTFGVDAAGIIVASGCPYGYKYSWYEGSDFHEYVLPYPY